MQALPIHRYGKPEVLTLERVPMPAADNDKLLVKIHAAAVNPVDYKIRNGSIWFVSGFRFPKILGGDVAGVIEQAPRGSKFKVGDRVFAMLDFKGGGYAQYAAIREEYLAVIPGSVSFNDAAAVPLAGLTSLQALRDLGNIREGMEVLVYGASGGVGHLAVQIARYFGARVTAVCSGPNVDWVRQLGADVVVDYTTTPIVSTGLRFDIVYDAVAALSYYRSVKILAKGGTYISTIPSPGVYLSHFPARINGHASRAILARPSGADLEILSEMMRLGKLKPVVEQLFPLSEGAKAHHRIETGRVKGKLVLVTD